MKRAKITVIMLVAMLILAACGADNRAPTQAVTGGVNQDATQASDGGTIEIRVAWWGSQLRHDRTVEVINMFMDQYPHIRVLPEFFDPDGYWIALNTRAVARDVWDVFQLGSNFPVYRDNILVLNDLIAQGHIDVSNTSNEFIEITSDVGEVVGISNGVNAWGIAYDPAIFELAGVPLPHIRWTWEEFEAMALGIHESLGIWGMSRFGTNPGGPVLTQFLVQQGVDFWHEYDNTQLGFDDPSYLVPFFELWRTLVQAGAAPDPGAAMLITDIEGDPVVTGLAAMTYIASNQFVALANAADRPLSMLPLPAFDPYSSLGRDVVSSQMFSIANNSRHPEIAAKFISFFQNNIEANQILQGERGIPIMNHVRETLQAEADPMVAETYAFIGMMNYLGGGAAAVFGNPNQSEIEAMANLLLDEVVFDMTTPEQAAQELFEFALSIIS
ncbi:MAG: ABC transporter substrate-binding protein [Defluviitaleaceae bacterium]|nr:ABC transporter substrate-binding protein [Defluviitaleaceae bacterium]